MARNFKVRIVLERGIIEIPLEWLVGLWAEGFIDVKTQSGQYGKEQRGNQEILLGGALQAGKKLGRTLHIPLEQISAIEAW
jgi:hypothetical protein